MWPYILLKCKYLLCWCTWFWKTFRNHPTGELKERKEIRSILTSHVKVIQIPQKIFYEHFEVFQWSSDVASELTSYSVWASLCQFPFYEPPAWIRCLTFWYLRNKVPPISLDPTTTPRSHLLKLSLPYTVADPGFSPGGVRQLPKLLLFYQICAKNCMKMKEFGPPGGAYVPGAPLRSANAIFC